MPERIARVVDVRTSPMPERIAAIDAFVAAGYESSPRAGRRCA
jgi:spore photoproduct lyase